MAVLIVCASSLIAALLTLFSGFGLGSLLLPAFAPFFPLAVAVAAVAVVHLANNLFKLGLVGRYADRKVALIFGLPGAAASFGGAYLLGYLAGLPPITSYVLFGTLFRIEPVSLAIGLIMVAFAFLEMMPFFSELSFDRRLLPFGGLLSGFFGGLSGHQGAFRSAFLIKSGLSREAYIGTGVVCAVMVDLARLSVYGTAFLTEDFSLLSGNAGLLVAAGTASAFAGSFLGARLFQKVTFRAVQRLVCAMLVILGLSIAAGLAGRAR